VIYARRDSAGPKYGRGFDSRRLHCLLESRKLSRAITLWVVARFRCDMGVQVDGQLIRTLLIPLAGSSAYPQAVELYRERSLLGWLRLR